MAFAAPVSRGYAEIVENIIDIYNVKIALNVPEKFKFKLYTQKPRSFYRTRFLLCLIKTTFMPYKEGIFCRFLQRLHGFYLHLHQNHG